MLSTDADDTGGERDGATVPPDGLWDEGVRMLDAEAFHAEWSGVRAGVDYVPGTLEAERVAGVLRALYRWVEHRGTLDRVQAMTDLDGRAYVRVDLGAAGALDVACLVLDGLRFRGELVEGAR
jgi:hypothetical protein